MLSGLTLGRDSSRLEQQLTTGCLPRHPRACGVQNVAMTQRRLRQCHCLRVHCQMYRNRCHRRTPTGFHYYATRRQESHVSAQRCFRPAHVCRPADAERLSCVHEVRCTQHRYGTRTAECKSVGYTRDAARDAYIRSTRMSDTDSSHSRTILIQVVALCETIFVLNFDPFMA